MSVLSAIRNAVNPPVQDAILSNGSGGGDADPRITVQPVDAVVAIGADATFTVAASGTEPISFQWYEFKF